MKDFKTLHEWLMVWGDPPNLYVDKKDKLGFVHVAFLNDGGDIELKLLFDYKKNDMYIDTSNEYDAIPRQWVASIRGLYAYGGLDRQIEKENK